MYVQPLDGSVTPNSFASPAGGLEAEGTLNGGIPALSTGDNISRIVPPPWLGEAPAPSTFGEGYGETGSMQGLFGPLMGMLQQLMQMLQSLMGYGCSAPYGSSTCPPYGSFGAPPSGSFGAPPSGNFGAPPNGNGGCPPYGNGSCPPYGNERFFQNASGASDGDPHLSFNGARWNNMSSQPDLLNSDSFAGGFRISTQVTPPNANGVTWNQSATVALNNGTTTISMNDNGQASITSYGQTLSISRGQTLQLGNGDSVTYEENGALRVSAQNGAGGNIETTLAPEGKGVNVDVTAHDVDLGGTLVHGYEERRPNPSPTPNPISGPLPTPVPMPNPVPVPNPISGPAPILQQLVPQPQPLY